MNKKLVKVMFMLSILGTMLMACAPNSKNTSTQQDTHNVTQTITIATTTSVQDSGLLKYVLPALKKDTNIDVKVIAQGTGQALKTAENGDADLVLVHAKKSEQEFISKGFGVKRIEFMYNYFNIVGPKDDPAMLSKLKDKNSAAEMFRKIASSKVGFLSRGDDSGTHKKEISIWESLSVKPEGNWYVKAGTGMGAVLKMASEKKLYTLTDRATYLSLKDKIELICYIEKANDLKNTYSLIAVNKEKNPNVNFDGANKVIAWFTSKKGLDTISKYGMNEYGENLFTVIE